MEKLLIVDDEPIILKGLTKILDWSRYGFGEVLIAESFDSAVEIAILEKPSLCLCDVCIGCEKGYELISKLRMLGISPHVIMMSGYEEFKYARESLRQGALDYLLKPIDADKLQSAVKYVAVDKLKLSIEESKNKKPYDPVLKVPYDELPPLIGKIAMIVAAEYSQPLNLKILAEKFRMNSVYMGQIFLIGTGKRFSEYLTEFRLIKAHEMLLATNDKIVVVARAVGYDNMSYFYTQFKKQFRISPSDVRARPILK